MATRRTTNFVLNEVQERDLVEYCLDRNTGLHEDNRERIEADRQAKESYRNKRDHRKSQGGVFEVSNLVLPISSMIAESFISRTEDELFGTKPFFKTRPRGANDTQLAAEADSFFQFKFGESQARVEPLFRRSIEQAFTQRAVIFKVIKGERMAEWVGQTDVLWDRRTNQPVKVAYEEGADYVPQDSAQWDPVEEPGTEPNTVVVRSKLRADPSIIWDEERYEFKPAPKPLLRSAHTFRGAEAVLVDYDAFLCPTAAADANEADYCSHRYDKNLYWVKERFLERPWLNWKSFRATYQNETAKPKTELDRNKLSKESLEFDDKTHTLRLVECWVRRDVLGWGRPQEFMILIEPTQRKAIYYEFQANLCSDMKRPFETMAIAPNDGSWCGENLMEKLDQYQDYADKQFNRESVRNIRRANPIGGVHTDAVEEEPTAIEIGDGGYFRLKKGKRLQDFIEHEAIPDLDTRTQELIQFVIYLVQLWLSVSNLSQGDYADLPQNSTKYGIQATLREASKLGRRYIRRVQDAFTQVLTKMVKLQIDLLDEDEVFEVTEGHNRELRRLSADKVAALRKLDMNIELVLTQQTTEADIAAAELALKAQADYFATPPVLLAARRPMFVKIMEALGYKEVDKLLPFPLPLPPKGPGGPGESGMPAGPAAGEPAEGGMPQVQGGVAA